MSQLVYHDLIVLPLGREKPTIFWLRLFKKADSSYVAVVTEVPGNPSTSVVNCSSGILSEIRRRFELTAAQLVLYEISPRTYRGGRTELDRVRFKPHPSWRPVDRAAIERDCGQLLPPLPDHAELHQRVLDAGGGRYITFRQDVFEAVEVGSLPPPHNPYQCAHESRLEELREAGGEDRVRSFVDLLALGRTFVNGLSEADRESCRYHDANWRAIADESVRIIKELGQTAKRRYARSAEESALSAGDRSWLISLFEDPVDISGRESYTNGQHRGCALRFSGAERAAVVVGEIELGTYPDVWEYQGDG